MSRKMDRLPGKLITAVFLVAVMAFISLLFYTKLIPVVYMLIIIGILVIFLLVIGLLVWKFHHRIRFWLGTVLAAVLLVVMGMGSLYIYQTTTTLDNISGVNTEISKISVYVRSTDTAESLADISGYQIGILSELDRENTDEALKKISTSMGQEVQTREYQGLTDLVDGLMREETGAIVLNQAYLDIISEIDGYSSIATQIKEISSEQVETVIERKNPETSQNTAQTEEQQNGTVFNVFISGIDTRGGMTAKSRSDVNIIATINTSTRQVLLVSTPRDYFVPLSISGGVPDKLTHAGIYGVNVSMDTLEMLYGIDMNYYFRLNFGGFVNIIDALGGVTVSSDYDFSSGNYHFNQGDNFVNGEQALVFARERYAFAEGDRQRGRNQMAVIEAVIQKALSPDLLMNYSSVLAGIEGSFETNIPYDTIAELVRNQLSEGGSWNIVSYSVDGTGSTQKPYSMSQNAYVMIPDQTTVDHAKELMQKVVNGETLTQEGQ